MVEPGIAIEKHDQPAVNANQALEDEVLLRRDLRGDEDLIAAQVDYVPMGLCMQGDHAHGEGEYNGQEEAGQASFAGGQDGYVIPGFHSILLDPRVREACPAPPSGTERE